MLAATVVLSALSLGAAPAAAPAAAATAVTGSSVPGVAQRVIVIMRDQLAGLPVRTEAARRSRAAAEDQAPVVARLKDSGATHISGMSLVNAVAATMKPAAVARIRADSQVAAVVPDLPVRAPDTGSAPVKTAPTTRAATTGTTAAACPKGSAEPMTEPEALGLTGTDAAQRLATGKGVKVAFIADGIDVDNPEFVRPDGSHVITDYQDFSGDGVNDHTDGGEAFGDASAIAAQGSRTYDMSAQLPHAGLPKGCTFMVPSAFAWAWVNRSSRRTFAMS